MSLRPLILIVLCLLLSPSITQASSFLSSADLLRNPENSDGQLSPDGHYFSYIRFADRTTYIDLIDLKTGTKRQILKSNKKFPLRHYKWLNDNTLLLYTQKSRQYIYVFDLAPAEESEEYKNGIFTRLNNGYVVDTLDADPQHILYAHNNTTSKGVKSGLYRINVVNLQSSSFNDKTRVDAATPDLIRYVYDAGLKRIIGIFFDKNSKQVEMRYREYVGGEWQKILTFKEAKYTLMPIGFISENQVAVLTNKNTDKIVLQKFDTVEQKLGAVLYQHDMYDLTDAWLNSSGQALAVEYYKGGTPQKEWLANDALNWDDALKQHFAPNAPFVINVDAEQQKALIYLSSGTLPGQYHMYDAANDESSKLLSLYPKLDDISFASTSSFKVTVQDDIQVEAYLTRPNGVDHKALLVMPHGGPLGVREDNLFRPDVQMLANRGFSVLRINFRGSSGYGKAFQQQGVGQFGKQIEADISAVVQHVLAQQNYQHICAMGSSYGAYSSVVLASENPRLYDCVVAGFGIYDLPLLFNASNYRSGDDFGQYIAAVVGENTADKVEVSPVYYAEKLQAPVLILAGKKDAIAGFEQSNRMRYMLERANKDVEYYFYENSGHGHDNYLLDHHELALTLDFLYRQLGIPISAPGDLSEQDVELIARQYMLIADGYDNERMMPIDIEKSAQYLSKAKDYGHPRAFFNLAAHHSQGKVLALDLLKAREYYETAALLGYKNAHQRLAYGYMPNAVGISDSYVADEEKAFFHLNAAIKHEPSVTNQKRLAYFYCIASARYKDVDKCLAGFKKSLEDSTFNDGMRNEFAMAVIDGSYTQNERDKMTAFAEQWFGLTHISFETDIADVGIFEYQASGRYGKSGEFVLSEATSLSQVSDKISENLIALGVRFVPDTEGLTFKTERTLALIEWLEKDSQSAILRRDFVTIKRAPLGDWVRYFMINSIPPAGTTYTLNIYSVDGVLNYTKTFSE